MTLPRRTYTGRPVDEPALLAELPVELATLLRQENGFVAFGGGLHVRGACTAPAWHSLRLAWRGPESFAERYPALAPGDLPFAEDALGDQFILREDTVHRLGIYDGLLESLGLGLTDFLARCDEDPVRTLALAPLRAFQQNGGYLAPGQLLQVHPPFIFAAPGARSYNAVPALELLRVAAEIEQQIRDVPDGATVRMKVIE